MHAGDAACTPPRTAARRNWCDQLPPSAVSPAGRVVVPCYHSPDRAQNNICHGHTMLSDDGGASFYLGATAFGAAGKWTHDAQFSRVSACGTPTRIL